MAFICLFHINSSSIDSPTGNCHKKKSISLTLFFVCDFHFAAQFARDARDLRFRFDKLLRNMNRCRKEEKWNRIFTLTQQKKINKFYRLNVMNVSTDRLPYFSVNLTTIIKQLVLLMFSCDTQMSMYWNCALSFTSLHACFNLISYQRLNLSFTHTSG